MLTTMDSSPTGCSSNAALTCSSPAASTMEQSREQLASPPRQDACAKRPSSQTKYSNRHQPYPDGLARSPGCCSSDGDSVLSDGDDAESTTGTRPVKVKRVAANSRERKRMHTVNSAFDQLRELVPTYPSNRKLSKIDTLRLACTYIQDLVSLLHNTQGIQGEDVLYHQPPPFPAETFNGYPVSVKQEMADFPPFTTDFRMQPAACLRFPGPPDGCPESYPSSASESDSTTLSPPHQFMQQQQAPLPPPPPPPPASLSSRPPPLTRVSSEATASVHTRLAEASISCAAQVPSPLALQPPPPSSASMYQRQVNITSPLAMHAVHHNSTQNLLHSSLEHHSPPPVWQRPPNGFPLYGQ